MFGWAVGVLGVCKHARFALCTTSCLASACKARHACKSLFFVDLLLNEERKAGFKKTSSRLLSPHFHPSHRSTSTAAASTADGHHHTHSRDDYLLPIERAMRLRT
jgi:hypothetical protein